MLMSLWGAMALAIAFLLMTAGSTATVHASPAAALLASGGASAVVLADAHIDVPKVYVDVDVHHNHAWYKNPVVIGLGVVVLVLLIVLGSRGGGTTIIER